MAGGPCRLHGARVGAHRGSSRPLRTELVGLAARRVGAVATYGTLAEIGINLARRRADDFTLRFLPFIGLLELIVLPLAAPIAVMGRWAARLVAAEPPPDARLTETEVEWVVAEGQKHGSLGREPAEMIRNVLELKDLVVRDVMVPRTRVSAIEVTRPIPEVLKSWRARGTRAFPCTATRSTTSSAFSTRKTSFASSRT